MEVYEMITKCVNVKPELRPGFNAIIDILEKVERKLEGLDPIEVPSVPKEETTFTIEVMSPPVTNTVLPHYLKYRKLDQTENQSPQTTQNQEKSIKTESNKTETENQSPPQITQNQIDKRFAVAKIKKLFDDQLISRNERTYYNTLVLNSPQSADAIALIDCYKDDEKDLLECLRSTFPCPNTKVNNNVDMC